MDKVKLLSCGLLAIAGLGTPRTRVAPITASVGLVAFFEPVAVARRVVLPRAAATKSSSMHGQFYTVTATAYEAVADQTDDEPFVTADNSHIPENYGSHTRWLALSRDLLKPWGGPFKFGDKVRVHGVSATFDGVYTVHDTMNRRHHHCLDVLVHPREKIDLHQTGVKLQLASI
jgi:3D (Asp-Asp-Asp) domain-containing protein